jgi:hypothetical protein
MSDAADRALQRLQADDGAALTALARMVVDEATHTPLAKIASPRWVASQLTAVLEAAVRGDQVRAWVDRRIATERERWSTDERPLRTFMAAEAEEPLRALLGRAYAPDEELVYRIIDQAALRGLVRAVLADSMARWRKRVGDVDKGMLGGLGKRAATRGRGLFGNLGSMAENLVETVKEEVENTFDVRVGDVTTGANTEAMRAIARYIADPEHAAAFGEMRLQVLDVLLDSTIAELVEEADKLGPEEIVSVVVGAVRATVSQPDFTQRTEERVARLMAEAGDGTFGAWLDEVELREVWEDTTTELVTERLKAVVHTERFLSWWQALHA